MNIITITKEDRYFKEIVLHYYRWWGEELGKTLLEIKKGYQNSLEEDTLPTLRALIINDTLIGMYEIDTKDNIDDYVYEPYLANVYVKEEYRGLGYSRYLVLDAISYASKHHIKTLYLHTRFHNLYEPYGFTFLEKVKTKYGEKRIFAKQIDSPK